MPRRPGIEMTTDIGKERELREVQLRNVEEEKTSSTPVSEIRVP